MNEEVLAECHRVRKTVSYPGTFPATGKRARIGNAAEPGGGAA